MLVVADSSAEQWRDFTNNFATDLAPIITLFGEQITKQFLSESVSFLDNVIFGVAPLGIITAVVSVIRVYGNASLKSFIGRAQEPHGAAEAELCSSTSEDVCELWSRGRICRVFGRPKILEFFYTEKGEFYPTFEGYTGSDEQSGPPSCGIELPKDFFANTNAGVGRDQPMRNESPGHWKEVNPKILDTPTNDQEPGKTQGGFARYPNLVLNMGIRTMPNSILGVAATFGISLQLSFFVYATWTTFYNRTLYDGGPLPQLWSFSLAVSGTALLVIGMVLCALLVERQSCERWFMKKTENDPSNPKAVISWLQPGGQRVGDQLFNAFAHSQEKHEYVTSRRVDSEQSGNDPDSIRHPLIVLWIAIIFSILGFVCQFVGLRGLHGSVALYQLASTLCMSVIRALLRSRRLPSEENGLKDLRRDVEGHELDWQALNIEIPRNEVQSKCKQLWKVTKLILN